MTDPREPFETDSPVEGLAATDLDDARLDERGAVDLDTGAGETGAAEASSDTADLDTAIARSPTSTPEIEGGDPDEPGQRPAGRAGRRLRRARASRRTRTRPRR